ncbi:MAG: hypothetical protein ACLQVM_01570, partial [Terriglobia bacterium]
PYSENGSTALIGAVDLSPRREPWVGDPSLTPTPRPTSREWGADGGEWVVFPRACALGYNLPPLTGLALAKLNPASAGVTALDLWAVFRPVIPAKVGIHEFSHRLASPGVECPLPVPRLRDTPLSPRRPGEGIRVREISLTIPPCGTAGYVLSPRQVGADFISELLTQHTKSYFKTLRGLAQSEPRSAV